MIEMRFIPTWEELKQSKNVKIFNKFSGSPSETVSTSLLRRIFFYAIKNGERVTFPEEWKRREYISKELYEQWYITYYNKRIKLEYHDTIRSFSDNRPLDTRVLSLLQGEEED